MCPHECPGLVDAYGEEFRKLYTQYEKEGRAKETISARKLWFEVLQAQIETGTPYITYKERQTKHDTRMHIDIQI